MRDYEFDGTDFTNPVDGDDYTGAGANDFARKLWNCEGKKSKKK